jgi:hypothetical protein
MPTLTRSRDPDVAQETWRIYYGDVHAGTITQSVGNPGAAPKWEWRCGFYPGSEPGECKSGTAASFDEARAAFEAAWRVFLSKRDGLPALWRLPVGLRDPSRAALGRAEGLRLRRAR